jgi:signal transduction histidine kinase
LLLAGGFLLVCEVQFVSQLNRTHEPKLQAFAGGLIVLAMTVPIAWRRRAPLGVACVVMASVALSAASLPGFDNITAIQFVAILPPYAVAAYEPRNRAMVGLGMCLVGFCMTNLLDPKSNVSGWASSAMACLAAWVAGRVLRSRRAVVFELRSTTELIENEREARNQLAIADERNRVARELQIVVTQRLEVMVLQSEAAQRFLIGEPERADDAMAIVEETGRLAMADMRTILGLLRRPGSFTEFAPQPGIGQILSLVDKARNEGRTVELRVEGEPGPLSAHVELGIYGVVAEGLAGTRDGAMIASPMSVKLRFNERDVAIEMAVGKPAPQVWPTCAIEEIVALSNGTIEVQSIEGEGWRLRVHLPSQYEGTLA